MIHNRGLATLSSLLLIPALLLGSVPVRADLRPLSAADSEQGKQSRWEQYLGEAKSVAVEVREPNTVEFRTDRPREQVEIKEVTADQIQGMRLVNHNNAPIKVLMILVEKTLDEVQEMIDVVIAVNKENTLDPKEKLKIQLICTSPQTFRKLKVTQENFDKYIEYNRYINAAMEDIWMQDWGEIAMVEVAGEEHAQLVIFDTNRGRGGLAPLPAVLAKMWSGYYHKLSRSGGAGNYGGNIEVTPDNVLMIGDTSTPELRDLLTSRGYADRIALMHTSWLNVGHADEFMTTIPNKDAPRGYTVIRVDPNMALDLFAQVPREQLDTEMKGLVNSLYKNYSVHPTGVDQGREESYSSKLFNRLYAMHAVLNDYTPSADVLGEESVESALDDARKTIEDNHKAATFIEANMVLLENAVKSASGDTTTPLEIKTIPGLFEPFGWGNTTVALTPGAANMVVLRDHLAVPDPLLKCHRDAMKQTFDSINVRSHFIPDASYHYFAGQLHCGTNVFRHPNRHVVPENRGAERADKFRRLGAE